MNCRSQGLLGISQHVLNMCVKLMQEQIPYITKGKLNLQYPVHANSQETP